MLQGGDIKDWEEAGRIAKTALLYGRGLIKPGAKAIDVLDSIEKKIHDLGGEIAFPAQLSCNEIAAHYCSPPDDELVFEDQIICLDIGAKYNGCIGDNAVTVDLSGQYDDLVKASKEALRNAIKCLHPGIRTGEVGKIIGETIESFGYNPVRNLCGHGVDVNVIHCSPSIPNYPSGDNDVLEDGKIIAIEPFATEGSGLIYEAGDSTLFRLARKRPARSLFARELMKELDKYEGLPITTRWLTPKIPANKFAFGMRELLQNRSVVSYPPLVDKDGGMVSQHENTVQVGDKPRILTTCDEDDIVIL